MSETYGTIGFEMLPICCIIGDLPEERLKEQELIIDLSVELDFSRLIQSDSLQDTIDYVMLAEICKDVARNGKYHLIERLAVGLLDRIFTDSRVKSAQIKILKPSAFKDAPGAFVELIRTNPQYVR